MRRRREDDSGFTLLELLIAMSLAGLIFSVVSVAFVVSLGVAEDSTDTLIDSQSAAFSSAYFLRDVQSAEIIATGTSQCGTPVGDLLLGVQWTDEDGQSANRVYRVDYRKTGAAGTLAVTRVSCDTDASTRTIATALTSASIAVCGVPSCSYKMTLNGATGATYSVTAKRRLT